MATGVLGVESGLGAKGLGEPNAAPPGDVPPPKAEPPPNADPPPNGDAGVPAAKGDFDFSGVLAENGEIDGVLVLLCFAAAPNAEGELANDPNPPVEGVDAAVGGGAAPPNAVGAADAKAPNPPVAGAAVGTAGFPKDDWPKAD